MDQIKNIRSIWDQESKRRLYAVEDILAHLPYLISESDQFWGNFERKMHTQNIDINKYIWEIDQFGRGIDLRGLILVLLSMPIEDSNFGGLRKDIFDIIVFDILCP